MPAPLVAIVGGADPGRNHRKPADGGYEPPVDVATVASGSPPPRALINYRKNDTHGARVTR